MGKMKSISPRTLSVPTQGDPKGAWEEITWERIASLKKKELFKFLVMYDEYVQQIVNENGSIPSRATDFFLNDYQEWKDL